MLFNPKAEYYRYRHYFPNLRQLYQKKEVVVYTSLTLTLLTIAFFGFFALRPTIVTIASLLKEQKSKKQINNQLQAKINALAAAQKNYASIENALFLVDEALPTEPFLSQILYQLEILAQQQNLTINSLAFESITLLGEQNEKKDAKKSFEPETLSFSLSLKGDFENLNGFISSLEKLRRIVTIDSLTFNQGKEEEKQIMMLTLSGKVYFLSKEKL